MKIRSSSPIPGSGLKVTETTGLENFAGFYHDPNKDVGKVLLRGNSITDKHYFGKDYYEVVVDGSKAFFYRVTIFQPDDLRTIPDDFNIFLSDNYLRIEHPGFAETQEGERYAKLASLKIRDENQYDQLKIREQYELGKSYSLRKAGDYFVFDEKFLGSIDLEKSTIRFNADSKQERKIDLRQQGDEYILNVNLEGGSWGNFFIRNSENFNKITFERFDDTKAAIIQSVASLVENQSTESSDDFILLSPAPDIFKKLVTTDGVLTGLTLQRFTPKKIIEEPVVEAEKPPLQLEELFNPKYWYVYVTVCLGFLILGLLSFIPLRLFS